MDKSTYDKALLILNALHKKVIEAAEIVERRQTQSEPKKAA